MVDKENKITWVSTDLYGTCYKGNTDFDDREFAESLSHIKVKRIVLYSNGYLCGMQVFYNQGQEVSNGCYADIDFDFLDDQEEHSYITSTDGSTVTINEYLFTDNEEIVSFTIYSGDIIDGIGFETTKGVTFFHGGKGGNKKIIKLKDLKFGAVSGSVAAVGVGNYWHTIHSIQLHFFGEGKLEIEENSRIDDFENL
jgi:hypothetical protein